MVAHRGNSTHCFKGDVLVLSWIVRWRGYVYKCNLPLAFISAFEHVDFPHAQWAVAWGQSTSLVIYLLPLIQICSRRQQVPYHHTASSRPMVPLGTWSPWLLQTLCYSDWQVFQTRKSCRQVIGCYLRSNARPLPREPFQPLWTRCSSAPAEVGPTPTGSGVAAIDC